MSRGLFVTFEGGDGTGKSTQIARLAARLKATGHVPIVTREPGGTSLAEAIRALVLDPERRPAPMAEALLVEAARADLVERVIRPALGQAAVVLCDRFDDSTIAYQGAGRGLDVAQLGAWNRAATGGLRPDLTLLFDLEPGLARTRRAVAAEGTNRLDREPPEFHQRVRECYLELARAEPERFVVLDAALDPDRLEREVWSAVAGRLALLPPRAR